MTEGPVYTEYHPRWLRPKMSLYWWLQRGSYVAFMLRELSSIFIAWFVVYLLLLVSAVSQGDSSYREFLSWTGSPLVHLLNVVSLLFVVYHTITFFKAAPQAIVARVGGKRVPGLWIAASNYLAWALASAVVVWLLVGG